MNELAIPNQIEAAAQQGDWWHFLWFCAKIYLAGLATGAALVGMGLGWRVCKRSSNQVSTPSVAPPPRSPPSAAWDVAVQSQVTYTRHCLTPRFKPLGEGAHGAWVQRDGVKQD